MPEQEEIQEETQPVETETQTETLSENEGKEFVEFKDPETDKRFKRMYGHMKQNERVTGRMAEDNRKLLERVERMEQEAKSKSTSDRTSELRAEEKQALEEGDFEKASQVRDQLTDLKLEAKAPKPEKKEEPPKWLTPDRENRLAEWAGATDANGSLLRPWAHPDHDDHETALHAAKVIIEKNPDMPMDDLLSEIEKVNARVTRRPTPAVLGASSDVRPKTDKKITLSDDEKLIAQRMYPGNPKAAEKYAAAKAKYL